MREKIFINRLAIFLILILVVSYNLSAQNDDTIEFHEQTIQKHQNAIDEIFGKLEELKLNKVREDILNYGMPEHSEEEEIVHHLAFSLSYNTEHKQANWVAHIVTKDILYGNVSRTNDFRPDPAVSVNATLEDYWYSGYDRGHLAPSADFRWSLDALSESYYYSNISPQVPALNRDSWARLENQVREWVVDAEKLYVVTGPVLHDNLPKIQQGNFNVSIPEYFYKIVLDYERPDVKAIAFILPNKKVDYRIIDYVVSIDSVERLTGIKFFPNLPDSVQMRVKAMKDIKVWPLSVDAYKGNMMPIDFGKGQVATSQARYFIGDETTVCGVVVATRYKPNGKADPNYLNLDKPFPDVIFSTIVFGKDRINFTYKPEEYLLNKKICVTGRVGDYQGTPQIIVTGPHQIEVID
jgi:endonuclease G